MIQAVQVKKEENSLHPNCQNVLCYELFLAGVKLLIWRSLVTSYISETLCKMGAMSNQDIGNDLTSRHR